MGIHKFFLIGLFLALLSIVSSSVLHNQQPPRSLRSALPRPVVLMHGILATYESMLPLRDFILQQYPDSKVFPLSVNDGLFSGENMWTQITNLRNTLTSNDALKNGFDVICHSQGGILFRAYMESFEDHGVNTFIALSSPLMGQYGETNYLTFLFPTYTTQELYHILYTSEIQNTVSVANYWKDPNEFEEYLQACKFLPYLNNEIFHNNSVAYRSNFMKIKKLVLISGPDDGVIMPWESAHFGFYDKSLNIVPMEQQLTYVQDSFGLKTLNEAGSIVPITVPGIAHVHWQKNQTIFDDYIKPYLLVDY